MANEERRQRPGPLRIVFVCLTVAAALYSVYWAATRIGGIVSRAPAASTAGERPLAESEKPNAGDLVGLWVPDEKTRERLKSFVTSPDAAPRLLVEENSYRLLGVPYLSKESGPKVSYATTSGRWNLYRQQDTWALYLSGPQVEARGLLFGGAESYRMMLVVGDPSLNQPLWLVRRRPSRSAQ